MTKELKTKQTKQKNTNKKYKKKGEKMNITKILFSVIAAIMIVTNTNATTMCVDNDLQTVILDPNEVPSNYSWDASEQEWFSYFSVGTIQGIARCTEVSGSIGIAYPDKNFDNSPLVNNGATHCWCRMTSPVRSAWIYAFNITTAACDEYCARTCGRYMEEQKTLRINMFNSAGM